MLILTEINVTRSFSLNGGFFPHIYGCLSVMAVTFHYSWEVSK